MTEYKPGDQVKILTGGPHENMGRTATVSRIYNHSGDLVIYFGDQDEDEWVYAPDELERL